MKSYKWIILLLLSMMIKQANAQTTGLPVKDEEIVSEFFRNNANRTLEQSTSDWVIKAALHLLNTPYLASTLEKNEKEQLVVNLRELDCMTFVENCLALSRVIQQKRPDFELFCRELRHIRYDDGVIDGYASRLHYTSAWVTDNAGKNILDNLTKALGGSPLPIKVSYMSTHPEKYPALENNPEQLEKIRKSEAAINTQVHYYISKQNIRKMQSQIKDGDIICFTTSVSGLDISHVGIAYRQKGKLTFIHASSKAKKVIVNPESLADYCMSNSSTTGIMVLRPIAYIQY